jgi:hypothetical protein
LPNIRIVNWNIEKLSANKVAIGGAGAGGLGTAMGRVIHACEADVAIILEVSSGTAIAAMTAVSAAANAASVAAGGNANDYSGWLLSYDTGGECYGVLIKNLNLVRPIVVATGPSGAGGYPPNEALDNLDRNTFGTWPGTFGVMANAYPGMPAPGARPRLPLTDVYSSNAPVGRKRRYFSGRTLASGGYALGRGFRLPCLVMLHVLGAAQYLIPVLTCHLGAVRGGANTLARGQIQQYKDTSIAQKFAGGGYIALNGAAARVQELAITGDFNVDFLQNQNPPGTAMQTANRAALNGITPTAAGGGSALPGALPGAAGPIPAVVPFPEPLGGWPAGPIHTIIPNLTLKAAGTTTPTMLVQYQPPAVPPPYAKALFDYFCYGGTQLSPNGQLLNGIDAQQVGNVPEAVVNGPAGAGVNVAGAWAHYAALPPRMIHGVAVPHKKTVWAAAAANLNPAAAGPPAMTTIDRLVGAQFISDHLPTVLQVNLP